MSKSLPWLTEKFQIWCVDNDDNLKWFNLNAFYDHKRLRNLSHGVQHRKFQARHTVVRVHINDFQIFSNFLLAVCLSSYSSLDFHSTLIRSAPNLFLVEEMIKSTTRSRDRRIKVFFSCLWVASTLLRPTHQRPYQLSSNKNPDNGPTASHPSPLYPNDRTGPRSSCEWMLIRRVLSTPLHRCRNYANDNRTR